MLANSFFLLFAALFDLYILLIINILDTLRVVLEFALISLADAREIGMVQIWVAAKR